MSCVILAKLSFYQNFQKIRNKLLQCLGSPEPVDFDPVTDSPPKDSESKSDPDRLSTMSRNVKVGQSLSANDCDWMQMESTNPVLRKMQNLVLVFQERAEKVKERITQPPTPSPSPPLADSTDSCESPQKSRPRLESLIQKEDIENTTKEFNKRQNVKVGCCQMQRRYLLIFPVVLDPQSKLYISWLFFVMLSYVYNAWGIVLRAVFPYQTPENLPIFLTFDYIADVVYVIDIALFKIRLQFLHDGFWVDDPEKTRKNYFRKTMFKMDVLSLLPLDLLYFIYGTNPLFRLPRLLKTQTFWEFFHRVDAVAKTPYVIRIIRTLLYMMYLIHLNACAYYAMSTWEGIGSNGWVFQGEGNAYIRCFYFATKTATSIGKNPKPENEYEYVFMTISWLMGVFIFAFLIGQIRDIVATATQSKTQYRQLMDQTVMYMRNLNLPDDLQRRVRLWLNHTWEQQKTFNEGGILDSLPRKMKTDVAINVHYNTLVKVQLFKDCDKALLRDLVLQLKPVLFLPGDYICKKGEVGKEMYIVNKGLVQVTDGENGEIVLATLSEGSVFGEISLLGISGCSRRTADVRSQGFSNLFVLSKDDLWEALKNYPEAQKVLRKKAKMLIKENEARDRASKNNNIKENIKPVIRHDVKRPSTPQLVKTVLQVVPKESRCKQMLTGKSGWRASHNPLPAVENTSPKSQEPVLRRTSMPPVLKTKSSIDVGDPKNFIVQSLKTELSAECKKRSLSAGTFKFASSIHTIQRRSPETRRASSSMEDKTTSKLPLAKKEHLLHHQPVTTEESKAIFKTIRNLIPSGDFYYRKRLDLIHPTVQQDKEDDTDTETPKPNSSEDSGISVDLNKIRHRPLPTRKSDEDFYSTEDSGDSSSEFSTLGGNKQKPSLSNSEKQNVTNTDQETVDPNNWVSPTSSVLSLNSLFRTNSGSRSGNTKTNAQQPHQGVTPDLFDLSNSVTSGSTTAGYDNLAFVPAGLFSRRSSIFSDSSC